MSYFQKHKRAFYGTFIFHAIVLILMLVCGFFTPLPLPEEEGLLVDFGDSPKGSGRYEPPKQRKSVAVKQTTVKKKAKPTQPKVVSKPKPASKPVSKPKAKQQVMTQDMEKTATVDNGAKREEERKKKALEEGRRLEREIKAKELERKKAEEAEQKRLAEIERKKREEEAERQRIAKERERKKAAIDKMTQNAFAGAGKSTSTSKGQGVSYPGGNQGVKTGTANANNYGQGGGVGNGPSYSLSGRSGLSLPEPNYPGDDEGVVVVEVIVDKYGKVTKATPGVKGTNTPDADLWAAAKKAALAARFNRDNEAPAYQQGTITYRFGFK